MAREPTVDLVFDADCVLCSAGAHFVLARERAPTTRFIHAWSQTGLALAARHGLTAEQLDVTFLLVRDGKGYLRSDAAIEMAKELRAPWSWGGQVLRLVPRPLRDGLYTFVATRRIGWFGKRERCFVPTEAARGRFVDDRVT